MKNLDSFELGTIEREVYVDAAPEVVYDVISSPANIAQWFPDEASYDAVVGGTGTITFTMPDGPVVEAIAVVEAEPPRTFSFRWTQPAGEQAGAGNSLLVTFALSPSGDGTTVRLTETGYRERGWEAAVLEATFWDHAGGWEQILPRLAPYAESVAAAGIGGSRA